MADRIQLRRDTAANWTAYNPILLEGEPGIEIDTDQWKLGDGVHTWSQLAYRGGECVQQRGQSTTVAMSQKAVTDELNLIGVFDISAHNLTDGQPTKYADLTAALGTNGANVPEQYRVPGMTIRYVQSSDNKYVQFRYMSSSTATGDFTNVANWQGVDDEPTAGSDNLVKSGGIVNYLNNFDFFNKISPVGYTRASFVPKVSKNYLLLIKTDLASPLYNVLGYTDNSNYDVLATNVNSTEWKEIPITKDYVKIETYYGDDTVAYNVYAITSKLDYDFRETEKLAKSLTTFKSVTFSGNTNFTSEYLKQGYALFCYFETDSSIKNLLVIGDNGSYTTLGTLKDGQVQCFTFDKDYTRVYFNTNGVSGSVTVHYCFLTSDVLQQFVKRTNQEFADIKEKLEFFKTKKITYNTAYTSFSVSGVNGKYINVYYEGYVPKISVIGKLANGTLENIGDVKSNVVASFLISNDYTSIYFNNNGYSGTDVTVNYYFSENTVDAGLINAVSKINKPLVRMLCLGDSFTAPMNRWINTAMTYFQDGSSVVNLAVIGALLRNYSNDLVTYPYSSRPENGMSGNGNTFGSQIEKLKRLMAGTDLDEGEAQIYTDQSQYPNVIVIAGGQNDAATVGEDTQQEVEAYPDQLYKFVDGVYVKINNVVTPNSSCYIQTPIEEVDRTTFCGIYRYLIEELQTLFPKAQIFIATVTPVILSKTFNCASRTRKIAEQQRISADMLSISLIDWHQDSEITPVSNYPSGSGTSEDPYVIAPADVSAKDLADAIHPNSRGGKKLGDIAGLAISRKFITIPN